MLGRVLYGGLVLGGFWLLGSWLGGLANLTLGRTRIEPQLRVAISRAIPAVALGFGALAALSVIGVDTRALLVLLASLGLGLGLALRDPLADLLAGVQLLSERPYALHDHVRVGPTAGRVRAIGLLGTTLEGEDGALIHVRSATLRAGPLEVRRPRAEPVPPPPPTPEPPPQVEPPEPQDEPTREA